MAVIRGMQHSVEKRAVNFLFIVAGLGRVHYSRILGNAEIERVNDADEMCDERSFVRSFVRLVLFFVFSWFREPRTAAAISGCAN